MADRESIDSLIALAEVTADLTVVENSTTQVELGINATIVESSSSQIELVVNIIQSLQTSLQVEVNEGRLYIETMCVQVEFVLKGNRPWPITIIPDGDTLEYTDVWDYDKDDLPKGMREDKDREFEDWNFVPSPDVFGYINNPFWETILTDAHKPCGHWHVQDYNIVKGPPSGIFMALACEATRPYIYTVCTNGILHKITMKTGKLIDWIVLDSVIIANTDFIIGSAQDMLDMQVDQNIWMTKSGAVSDHHLMIMIVKEGMLEAYRINLREWRIVGYSYTNEGLSSIRGGNTHGDYSVWGMDSNLTMVWDNINMELHNFAMPAVGVPDFTADNRGFMFGYASGFNDPIDAYSPVVAKPWSLGENHTIQEPRFQRTVFGLAADWFGWCRADNYWLRVSTNYHPLWPRIRGAFPGLINIATAMESRYTIKFTAGNAGMHTFDYGYMVGMPCYLDGLPVPSAGLGSWQARGNLFDGSRYGGVMMYIPGPEHHNAHVLRIARGDKIDTFFIDYGKRGVKVYLHMPLIERGKIVWECDDSESTFVKGNSDWTANSGFTNAMDKLKS